MSSFGKNSTRNRISLATLKHPHRLRLNRCCQCQGRTGADARGRCNSGSATRPLWTARQRCTRDPYSLLTKEESPQKRPESLTRDQPHDPFHDNHLAFDQHKCIRVKSGDVEDHPRAQPARLEHGAHDQRSLRVWCSEANCDKGVSEGTEVRTLLPSERLEEREGAVLALVALGAVVSCL